MATAEVRIIPIGTRTSSLAKHVARAVNAIKGEKDIEYQLTATGTILEGDLEKILSAARKMHEAVFAEEVARVVTTIEIDDRRDRESTMESKVESVQKELT